MQTDIRHLIIIISLLILASCGQKNKSENAKTTINSDSSNVKQAAPMINSSDIISFPCAIIFSPPKKIIDSLKKADSTDFYTAMDDVMYYRYNAAKYFDSLKIKTMDKIAEGTIKFHMTNGKDTLFSLNDFYWDILLFNGKDEPIRMGRSDFDIEVDSYMFNKK